MEVTRKNTTNRLKITELNDDHTCATVADVTDKKFFENLKWLTSSETTVYL